MKKYFLFALFMSFSVQAADDTLFGRNADDYGPKPNAVTFSLFSGWYWHGQSQNLIGSSDYFKEAWNPGIRLGYAIDRNFELEGTFGFSPTKSIPAAQNVYYWSGNVIGQVPLMKIFAPYLTAGLGQLTISPESLPSSNHFAINYGGGVKVFLFKNLAFHPDLRGLTSFDHTHTAMLFSLNLTYYAQLGKGSEGEKTSPAAPQPAPTATPASEASPAATPSAPAQPAPPPAQSPKQQLKDFSGIISGIHFETNSAKITPTSFEVLDNAASFFVKHPELNFRIEGHTDDTGSNAHNQRLSEERAGAVKRYLVDKGVRSSQVVAEGYGETRPTAENGTPEGRAKNRRIEFKILNPEFFKE